MEDNQANRDLLREYLNALGHVTIMAETGESAVQLADHMFCPPDLVLLDIRMPGISGYEVLGDLRSRPTWQGTPILALTASAMPDDRQRALQAGFDAFITKPLVLADLRQEIDQQLAIAGCKATRSA